MDALKFMQGYKSMCRACSDPGPCGPVCDEDCPMIRCHDSFFCNREILGCPDDILEDVIELVEAWCEPICSNDEIQHVGYDAAACGYEK